MKFTGEDFGAARDEDMDVESAVEQFLEVVGRNEILIFRVLSNKTGDVRAERHNAEMIDAGEIERSARKVGSQAVAFEWRRHFSVRKNNAAGKALIRDNGEKAANAGFEAVSRFVVCDGYVVEIHVHGLTLWLCRLFHSGNN